MTTPMRGWCKMHSARRQTAEASEGLASFAEKAGGELERYGGVPL